MMIAKLWPLVVLFVAVTVSTNVNAQTPPALWENVTPAYATPTTTWADGIAVDPSRPGTVYVSSSGDDVSGEGIWKSTNYGAPGSFVRVDLPFDGGCGPGETFAQNWGFAVDDIGYVYTTNGYGCGQGLYRSTDGGVNWTNVHPFNLVNNGDINNIMVDPYLEGHIVTSFHSGGEGDLESFDRGNTWVLRSSPGPGWVNFVNNSTTWIQGAPGGIFRTTDSGLTWTQVNTNVPTHAGHEILRVGNTYYLGSDAGVLRSTNDGVSWTLTPDGNADGTIAVGTDGNGRLFTRTANVLSASTGPLPMLTSTDGVTWTAYNSQMFINGPNNFSRDSKYLYVSMLDGGVWRLPLNAGPLPPTPTMTPVGPTPTSVPPTPTNTPLIPPTPTVTPIGPTRQCTLRWGSNTIESYGNLTQAECAARGN